MEVNTFTNVGLARGKLELSSSLRVTFTEIKCMIRMMCVAITRTGVWGARRSPPDVVMATQISAPILKSTSNTTGTIGEVLPWDKHVIKVDDSGRITKRSRRFLRVATGGMGNNASPSSVRLAPLVPATLIKTPSLSSPVSDPDHITLVLFPLLSLSSDRPSSPPPPITFDHS